jgi:hypothetical protein
MSSLHELVQHQDFQNHKKINQKWNFLYSLLAEIEKKKLKESVVALINKQITDLNTFSGTEKKYLKKIRTTQYNIIQILEKEMNIVPKSYYRNKWFTLGLSLFGITFGVVFSVLLDNFAFVGIGLPIGMTIGMAIGANKDKEAKKEGRQLDIDIKW